MPLSLSFIKHRVDENGKVYGHKLVYEEDYSFRDWMELGHNVLACVQDFVSRILRDEPPLIPIDIQLNLLM